MTERKQTEISQKYFGILLLSVPQFPRNHSCLNNSGTPQLFFAALRRQTIPAQKTSSPLFHIQNNTLSKSRQLPALRTVVNEPAQQKHRFVLLLYSQSIGSPSILGENVFQQPPMTCVTRCRQGLQACFGGQRIPPQPHSPRTAARMAKQRSAVFVLFFCPSGRAKWVRASAWNCPRL